MRISIRSVPIVLLASLATGACTTSGTNSAPRAGDSLALTVMRAARAQGNLRDAQASPPASVHVQSGSFLRSASDIGGLAGSFTAPVPGFTSLGAGLMTGVAVLVTNDAPPAESFNRIIAWMPQREAATPEAARERIVTLVGDALDRGFRKVGLGGTYTMHRRRLTYPTVFGERVSYRMEFTLTAAPCNEPGIRCTIEVGVGTEAPELVIPPPALGLEAGYMFGTRAGGGIALEVIDTRPLQNRKLARFPFLEGMIATSAELPEWVYLYAAPMNATYFNPDAQHHVFLRTPLLLHRGEILLFVRGYRSPVPIPGNS